MNSTLISLVVPAYNESKMIASNIMSILAAAEGDNYELELIVVDDGSTDETPSEVERVAAIDLRIKLISFTRNFGKEAAIQAGLEAATGDACIVLDGDLQHPPELVPRMVNLWRDGFYVVDAVKLHRGDKSKTQTLYARTFYRIFSKVTGLNIENHSDFKLLDRSVVDVYLSLPERERFFRGLIYWAQYPAAQLPFSVKERAGGGDSQWSRVKLLRYASNNITSFSSVPLKLVGLLGVLSLFVGGIIALVSIIQKLSGAAVDGFTTVNLLIILMNGAVLVSLGVIGHYLGRIYNEIKARPSYLIKPTRKNP